MTEAHEDLADRLELARRRLVEDHLEASRPRDRGRMALVTRRLRGLTLSLPIRPSGSRADLRDDLALGAADQRSPGTTA